MSRSAFYPFNRDKRPSDGHYVKNNSISYVQVYCPKVKDLVGGTNTSIGVKCDHCGKHI